ncbi:MAG: circularly permuted type 2 ATP-grasp protein, partial [Thermoleophilaceae bacterium]
QRARALCAFLADASGDRRIVTRGLLPARVIETAAYHEPWVRGIEQSPAGFLAGLDLVRGSDGHLRVLEDNCRTPSGLGYAVATRRALDAELGVAVPPGRMDTALACGLVADALRAAAPDGVDEPHVVMLSDGPGNSAWYEHRLLAGEMGIEIVTPGQVERRGGRLHGPAGDSADRPIDVIYRRTDEDRLKDSRGSATWLADLVLEPVREGTLAVVNPLGSGLADEKLVHAYVDEMVRFYLGEEPILRSVKTYDLGDPDQLVEALERFGDLVIKPRDGYGGIGVVLCRHASAEERRSIEARVRDDPDAFVAQETITLSTHPTVVEGRLEPRHVDLRPFVVGGGRESAAAPGALTRVAFEAGELVVNSSRNGGGKDTWVMG